MSPLSGLLRVVSARADSHRLAVARMIVGSAAVIQTVDSASILSAVLRAPGLRFPYEPFAAPMTGGLLVPFVAVSALAAFCFTVGWRTRLAGCVTGACMLYTVFIDQQAYSNHQVLLSICSVLIALGGGGAAHSVDARLRASTEAMYWPVFLLKAQLSIVYAFAALSKMNTSYMSGAVLLYTLRSSGPLAFDALRSPSVLAAMVIGSIAVELFLAVAFWVRRLRGPAALTGLLFHAGLIGLMRPLETLQLVVFAMVMFALYVLFFGPVSPALRVEASGAGLALGRRGEPVSRLV
jgi:hypothetical protein